MKIKFMTIMFILFCLTISAIALCSGSDKVQNVGGDFGRAWISNYLADNPRPVSPGSNNSSSTASNNTTADWGGEPKGNPEIKSDLVKPQDTTVTPTDWLGSNTIANTNSQTSATDTSQNGAKQTYFASGTLSPVHKIDESFNQNEGMPEPDANGLINGIPAESYYAIGPALFTF
ncbi:MAG: hypothetical protein ACE14P_00065 [Methanotrichaceae archaeon]